MIEDSLVCLHSKRRIQLFSSSRHILLLLIRLASDLVLGESVVASLMPAFGFRVPFYVFFGSRIDLY